MWMQKARRLPHSVFFASTPQALCLAAALADRTGRAVAAVRAAHGRHFPLAPAAGAGVLAFTGSDDAPAGAIGAHGLTLAIPAGSAGNSAGAVAFFTELHGVLLLPKKVSQYGAKRIEHMAAEKRSLRQCPRRRAACPAQSVAESRRAEKSAHRLASRSVMGVLPAGHPSMRKIRPREKYSRPFIKSKRKARRQAACASPSAFSAPSCMPYQLFMKQRSCNQQSRLIVFI